MSLTISDVEKLAYLARIDMSKSEQEEILTDLNNILNYVEVLNEVETENVEPLYNCLGNQKLTLRDDIVRPSLSQAEALKNAPEANSDYFKVPKVL